MTDRPQPLTTDAESAFMLAEYESLRQFWLAQSTAGEARLNYYLLTVSAAVVGIGLVNQLADRAIVPYVSGALIVGVFVIGLVTFARIVERTISMTQYVRGMNRIRRYFTDRQSALAEYLILPTVDDVPAFRSMSLRGRGLSAVGLSQTVAIINSILAGSGAMIVLRVTLTLDNAWAIAGGLLVFGLIYLSQSRFYAGRVAEAGKRTVVKFPSS